MEVIPLPQQLTEIEFEAVLENCYQYQYAPTRTLQFDLSGTEFISSFAMIQLLLLTETIIRDWCKRVSFKVGNGPKLSSHMYILARLGFFESLPGSVTYYPFRPKTKKSLRGKNEAILEVTDVKDMEHAYEVIELVEKAITKNTTYSGDQVKDICTMVSEMLQNIFYHSESKRAGLVSIQNYRRKQLMQLVIADAGVGIPETIRLSPDYTDNELTDIEAILESVKKGVSRQGVKAGRGEGLSHCVRLAKKHHAQLFIRSNSAWVSVTVHKGRGTAGIGEFFSGTQIFVNFPSN